MPPPYEKHIFVCNHARPEGHPRGCCHDKGGAEVRLALAQQLAQKGLKGKVRANIAGCMDACEKGVAVTVYPAGDWYFGVTPDDAGEFISEVIEGNGIVMRLLATEEDFEEIAHLRSREKKDS